MPNSLTMQEQVLLLCLNDESGKFEEGWVDYGLNGAALADLLLRGRIRLDEKERVAVEDPAPTGDDLLDRALARIGESKRSRALSYWVIYLYRGKPSPRQALIERLIDRGLLGMEEGRLLWVFPRTHYPSRDPVPELEVRERIRRAVLAGGSAEPALAALIGILKGCDALDRALNREELKRAKARIEEIVASGKTTGAAGKAVGEAVAAATAAAVVAATTAAVAASSS